MQAVGRTFAEETIGSFLFVCLFISLFNCFFGFLFFLLKGPLFVTIVAALYSSITQMTAAEGDS